MSIVESMENAASLQELRERAPARSVRCIGASPCRPSLVYFRLASPLLRLAWARHTWCVASSVTHCARRVACGVWAAAHHTPHGTPCLRAPLCGGISRVPGRARSESVRVLSLVLAAAARG